jgi:hypothetical protein
MVTNCAIPVNPTVYPYINTETALSLDLEHIPYSLTLVSYLHVPDAIRNRESKYGCRRNNPMVRTSIPTSALTLAV